MSKRNLLKNKRVLIVDDDIGFAKWVANHLEDAGCEATTVDGFSAAKKTIKAQPKQFDLALVDMLLERDKPKATGIQVARYLSVHSPSTLVVGMSQFITQQYAERMTSTFTRFLEKPFWKIDIPYLIASILSEAKEGQKPKPRVFIVHGRDNEVKLELKNFLQNKMDFDEPIILHEQPSRGRTIIEKFEQNSAYSDIVFVILTPDDTGSLASDSNTKKRRARQNVIFEMGYFIAKLQRASGRVILLHKGDIELPSDISGLIYIDISEGIEAAGEAIRTELSDWL